MAPQVLNLVVLIISLVSLPSLLESQQHYEGQVITDCQNSSNSTSSLGYLCNGPSSTSCQAYLTFHSNPPYQTPTTISALLGSDPTQLSLLNSVSTAATFPPNTELLVPINCSCSGGHYQANTSYTIQSGGNFLTIANNTYQGLSTCQALQAQNPTISPTALVVGTNITVPLRCACPTRNQTDKGVKYLLSYLVNSGDTVFIIAQKFGVTQQSILDANGLSLASPDIYPFTTLLIPLENQPNSSQTTSPPPPPPPPPTSPSPSGHSSNHTGVYVGIGVGAGALLLIASLVIFFVFLKDKRRKKEQTLHPNDLERYAKPDGKPSGEHRDTESAEEILLGITDVGHSLKVYRFDELQLATDNFSSACRIEGSVHRGVFSGDVAAVKKMNRDVTNEIEILKRINHLNVIRLSGVCFNQGHWFLVYEFASNGSLSKWIFNKTSSTVLSWAQRLQIALDVADGLNYLHTYIEPPYVHMDIKSSNILLDEKFRAKIANFSLARPVEGNEADFVLTRHIVGTKGYMAPEYLEHGLVSPMLDVYAFGVVMMELITGRDVTNTLEEGNLHALNTSMEGAFSEGDVAEKLGAFIDPSLERNYSMDLALMMARLIHECLQHDAVRRPSMAEISQALSKLCDASLSWELSNGLSEPQSFSSETNVQSKGKL